MYFEYFEGTDGQWYWRLKAANHQIIAVGGEGYSTESNVKAAIERLRVDLSNVPMDKL